MKEAMLGTGSLSSLSEMLLRPADSSLLHLLNLFSFLILILPCSVLSTTCLNILRFRLPCPWFDIKALGIVVFSGDKSGCSLSGGGCFLAIPLRMVIVRAESSEGSRNTLKTTIEKIREDELDRDVVAEIERYACVSILFLIFSRVCALSAHTSRKCSTCIYRNSISETKGL